MKNAVIKKFIIIVLTIVFLIQPILQLTMGINTVHAWAYTTYNLREVPQFNHETEKIGGQQIYFRYTFRVYGSSNGLKIWNDKMSSLDDSWLYTNNSSINNRVHVSISYKGENHLRVRSGYILPQKRRERVGLSYYAEYTTDWTTKVVNDARELCSGVHVVAADGDIETTLKPQKEILRTETKATYFIVKKTQAEIDASKPKSTGNGAAGVGNAFIASALSQYGAQINNANANNKPAQTTTTPSGSPVPNYSTGATGGSSGSSSGSGTVVINNRNDLDDNARRLYIRNLYKRVLKREPSNDEISGHFKNTSQKEATDIILSTESNMKNNINSMTNDQFVEACYNYVLGRTSDESGKKGWINYLSKGNSRASLINQFVASEEFKKTYNKETTTLTFNSETTTAVYDYLRDNGYAVIKPTSTTILMYKNDISKITVLDLNGKGLKDLSGLKVFTNLSKLSATNNKIDDLSKISELTNIQQLFLSNNNLKNLNGLEKLTKLNLLNASNNQITDISKVAQSQKLIAINLNNNKISDLTPLDHITTLKEIYVDNNNVKNSPVFDNLENIGLRNNKITITATNGEAQLPEILTNTRDSDSLTYTTSDFECTNCRVEGNKIIMNGQNATVTVKDGKAQGTTVTVMNSTEIIAFNDKVLAEKIKKEFGLSEVKEDNGKYLLFIPKEAINAKKSINLSTRISDSQKITDISGLEKLSQLTSIKLNNNYVTDYTKLSEIKTLETLEVKNNGITNLNTLNKLTQLKQLDVSNNNISDISGIENLTELQDLLLSHNRIGNNVQEISKLNNLATVSLIANEITDVNGLANLKVENLFLDRNGIADITPVKNENIKNVSLENNNVLINVKGSEVEIPEILKKAMETEGGVENLDFIGCSISNNKLIFDEGIKLAQIKIKKGELRDTILSVQDEDALLPPNLEVKYNLSNDKTGMIVTITADKPIQNVLSWNRVDENTISKTYTYNVSNQNLVIRDIYGNETTQLINFTGVKHPRIADLTVSYSENMITNKDVTITMSSSENLVSAGYIWTLSEDKKSVSATISDNTNHIYTTANVLTERMYNIQMQPAIIDIEVANIDKKAPECEVEYDVSNITKGAVKVIIWSNEEIEPINAYDSTAVVKVNEDGSKKYGIVMFYTQNANSLVTVKDLANNLTTVNVKIDNIDTLVDGLYSETNVTDATKQSVKLTIGADEKIDIPEFNQSSVIGKIKLKQYLTAKSAVRVANTVMLDSVGSTPVLKLAEESGEDGKSNFNVSTSEDGKEIEIELTESELGALLATDETNNKELTLVNTSVIDKKDINVTREDIVNEDGSVTVKLTTDKPVLLSDKLAGWDLGEDYQTLIRTFKENVEVDLELEDFAGNITNVNVLVDNVKGFNYEIYYYPIEEIDQYLVVIKSDKELQELEGWELSEDKKMLGKTMGVNEKMSLKVYDVDGFAADIEINVNEDSQEIQDTEENQNMGINDNTQSDKPMPQTGEYVLFALAISLILTIITGVTLFKRYN